MRASKEGKYNMKDSEDAHVQPLDSPKGMWATMSPNSTKGVRQSYAPKQGGNSKGNHLYGSPRGTTSHGFRHPSIRLYCP